MTSTQDDHRQRLIIDALSQFARLVATAPPHFAAEQPLLTRLGHNIASILNDDPAMAMSVVAGTSLSEARLLLDAASSSLQATTDEGGPATPPGGAFLNWLDNVSLPEVILSARFEPHMLLASAQSVARTYATEAPRTPPLAVWGYCC